MDENVLVRSPITKKPAEFVEEIDSKKLLINIRRYIVLMYRDSIRLINFQSGDASKRGVNFFIHLTWSEIQNFTTSCTKALIQFEDLTNRSVNTIPNF